MKYRTARPAPVAALRNGILVLGAFTAAEPVLGVSEIARRLDLSPSTVYRALITLEDLGLVEQDPTSSRYRLGPGVVALAAPLLANMDVRDVAQPYLAQLALASNESVNLAVWSRFEAVNVAQVPGPTTIKHLAPLGRRNPGHASAVGKVLLAHAPADDVGLVLDRGLPRLTERTIVDRAHLLEELERVRRHGYAVNDEELEPELFAVAAPVRDHRGQVVAAVSISAPSYRVPPARREDLAALVTRTADDVSRRLGHSAPAPTSRAGAEGAPGGPPTAVKV
jgi:DNA-binding IclR family transcriptional regulator